jgi:membrane protein implicated in regulation of membrane protease activity
MNTRRILVLVSVVGVAATLIAVTEGKWTYGLALYGGSVVAILALLRRALRERNRTEIRASSGAGRPAARDAGA